MRFLAVGFCLLSLPAFAAQNPEEPDTTAEDQRLLAELGVPTDGPGLLEYFRQRTYKEADGKLVASLVARLGDDDFGVRERAFKELQNLGHSAMAGLKEAERSSDAEVRQRIRELRQQLEAKENATVQSAVARLVAKSRPAGAGQVLLDYIPFAADQSVVNEIGKALGAVAKANGRVDPVIVSTLKDARSLKRSVAAEALVRAKSAEHLTSVKSLLRDPEPAVRLRVAMSLVPMKDKEVVPVLVDVLGHLPPDQLWPAEEVLVRLAGEKAPVVSLGTDEAGRKACQSAWRDWFESNKEGIDLAAIDSKQSLLGYTLLVQQVFGVGGQRPGGQVLELDAAKNERWKIDIATYPVDAQVVGQDRVLVAEYQGARVTERDFKGNIVWELPVGGNPLGVQRLPNGNTFVVMQQRLAEFDRNKKEVVSVSRPQGDVFRARKLRGGEIVMITSSGNRGVLAVLDSKTQKELKSFVVGPLGNLFGAIDILPNGNVLVPLFQENRVVEFDMDGKQVGNLTGVQLPTGAQRLPNGNTLISSMNTRRIVELDASGRVVWNYNPINGQVFNVRKR